MAEKTTSRHVTIARRPFHLSAREVVRALRNIDAEPINSHYVVIGGRRFPPKQAISVVTGLDRADFTSHQARRTLMRLGFAAGRAGASSSRSQTDETGSAAGTESLAERLVPLAGQWVAVRNDDLLHAASSPRELVGWLTRHGQTADTMFRVPEDSLAASGLAPL